MVYDVLINNGGWPPQMWARATLMVHLLSSK